MWSAVFTVLRSPSVHGCRSALGTQCRNNSNTASISRIKRATYVRLYPTVLVQPDGSTINVRYHEPRQLIRLPLKFEELTPEQQQIVLVKRKPPEKLVVQEEIEDNFDGNKYLKFMKKNT
ncbi:39S ribosomal protein L55, mitochondrial [Ixodes scapularis]|uniref:39S ribosomal protein L55, mitochondrial n=1 Tax=Ixodes scapularis TaxID=6945 RepID=UPI001A9D39BA|nr:39S ribosomal protein L55, mitochondrial [Ixodes scapularis]